jgi:transcriptional regulator of acetoin/glycerol metabolism
MASMLNLQREHHLRQLRFFREVQQASTQEVVNSAIRTLGDRLKAMWSEVPCYPPQLLLEEVSRIHILRVLELCGGNRPLAAKALGIGRTTMYRFLKDNVER